MSIHQQIGKRIKTARKEFGLTQKELASKLSKTPTAICYLERGQRRVTPEVLAKIAKVTKKPLSYFYGESIDENKLNEKIEFLNTHLYSVKKLLEKTDKQRVQLQNDAELFKKLFENISDMLFIADPETAELLYVNKQAYKGLGYKKEELMQKKSLGNY